MATHDEIIRIIMQYETKGASQIRETNIAISDLGKVTRTTGSATDMVTKKTKEATSGYRKATGALLGMMFTAMALHRALMGIINPVLETLGVFDMLGATILTVMLPALQPVADVLYTIMDWFMGLSETTKKWIGWIIIVGAAITGLVVIIMMIIIAFLAVVTFITATVAIIIGVILLIGLIVFVVIKYWDVIKAWFISFGEKVSEIFTKMVDWIKNAFKTIGEFITNIFEKVKDKLSTIWEGIKNVFAGVLNFLISGLNLWIKGFEIMINAAIKGLNALIGLINKVPGVNIGTIGQISLPRIPSFQKGGVMPYTGLAMLHKGETVTPAGGTTNNAPITINASVSSDYDVRRLADQLSKYWTNDMERISKARGMI